MKNVNPSLVPLSLAGIKNLNLFKIKTILTDDKSRATWFQRIFNQTRPKYKDNVALIESYE